MVMDATQSSQPSPQSVGREFVRQYYTLLNKAPNHLHRFYNNSSSFIHGESTLVIGQKNIHSRIQQLNFHDCHAKISQVDAQATLGNGVVVQVTGELSNDGQPMRRFTQTFVLAAQSPKKYYVHNDIFRYQDVYSDEENDVESRSENDEDHESTVSSIVVSGNNNNDVATGNNGNIKAEPHQSSVVSSTPTNGSGILPQQGQANQAADTPQQQQQAFYLSMPTAGGRPVPVLAGPQGAAVPLVQFTGGAAGVVASQMNGVVSHDDLLQQPQSNGVQQPAIVGQAGAGAGSATVVSPQVLTTGVSAIPIAANAIPQQNANPNLTGYQQSPLIPPQVLQHQTKGATTGSSTQQNQVNANDNDAEKNGNNSGATNGNSSYTLGNHDISPLSSSSSSVPKHDKSSDDDFKKNSNEQLHQDKYDIHHKQEQQQHQQQQPSEPKTYANLFKSTSSSPSGFVNAANQQQQQLQQQQQQLSNSSFTISSVSYTQSNTSNSIYNARAGTGNDNNSNQHLGGSGVLSQRNNAPRLNKDFDQRRSSNSQFGDSQQLFLGNIPHHATEDELKTIFQRFGNVLELRILSKPGGGKTPQGSRNPLNYGFITYEDPEGVQNCLANCPIYFPEGSPDAQKLNVEEKKPRLRQNDMPSRQSLGGGGGNMNDRNMNNGGQRGGPQSRGLSNSGGGGGGSSSAGNMMRGNNSNNPNMSRGNSGGGGPRMSGGGGSGTGGFNRNDRPSNNGQQMRSGAQSGGGNYGGRR